MDSGRLKLDPARDRTTIALELNVGPIRVDITHSATGRSGVAEVAMYQKTPEFRATYPAETAAIFGLTPADLLPGVPVQTVSTGTPSTHARRARPRHAAAGDAGRGRIRTAAPRSPATSFSARTSFCLGGVTPQGDVFARHFTGPPASFEDPFTGSATGGMAAFLWHYQLIRSPRFTAEQGHWLNRPGAAAVEVIGKRDAIETVRVAGPAAAVIRGELTL